jgi:Ferredoxin-like domain in Api92-like protein
MPNHCETDLYISGKSEDVRAVLEFLEISAGKSETDFCNKLIPYPDNFRQRDADCPRWDDPDRTEKIVAFISKYGNGDDGFNSGGYEWCVNNWGTKWGAYDITHSTRRHAEVVSFRSAWKSPDPRVFQELQKRFPTVTLHVEFYESGQGFCGGYTIAAEDEHFDDSQPWQSGLISSSWKSEYRGFRGG